MENENTNPKCKETSCNGNTRKAGKTKAGNQRYRCMACGKYQVEGDRSSGRPLEEGRTQKLTPYEKLKRYRDRQQQKKSQNNLDVDNLM